MLIVPHFPEKNYRNFAAHYVNLAFSRRKWYSILTFSGGHIMDDLILNAYFSDSSSSKAAHFHDCHQLIFVTRGSARFTIQHTNYTAKAGTLVLISRFEEHAIHSLTPDYHRYALDISADLGRAMADEPLLSVLVNRPQGFKHIIKAEIIPMLSRSMKDSLPL